jgi:outer membrane protein TolC
VESALAAYRANQAGYDRVLEARRAELEARRERVAAEVARARADVMLDYFSEG